LLAKLVHCWPFGSVANVAEDVGVLPVPVTVLPFVFLEPTATPTATRTTTSATADRIAVHTG